MFTDNRCMDMGEHKKFNMNSDQHQTAEMPHAKPEMMPEMGMPCECGCEPMMAMMCPPVYECPQERCVNRQIVHNVPHVVPIKTRVINHHIFRHSFTPCFTCCEENVCSNEIVGPHCGC